MKKSKRDSNINVRAEIVTKVMLNNLSIKMGVTQADVVEIALQVLEDIVIDGKVLNYDCIKEILSEYC